eukprot:scaffold1060_cov246-Pinguiococcus_pyrenoidosus.AAC.20
MRIATAARPDPHACPQLRHPDQGGDRGGSKREEGAGVRLHREADPSDLKCHIKAHRARAHLLALGFSQRYSDQRVDANVLDRDVQEVCGGLLLAKDEAHVAHVKAEGDKVAKLVDGDSHAPQLAECRLLAFLPLVRLLWVQGLLAFGADVG